jgi:hypothetical protein
MRCRDRNTRHSRMAAFGEWRGPLYLRYQPLERLLSGYDEGLLLTPSGRSLSSWMLCENTCSFLLY